MNKVCRDIILVWGSVSCSYHYRQANRMLHVPVPISTDYNYPGCCSLDGRYKQAKLELIKIVQYGPFCAF